MTTARDIITLAMKEAGVLGVGQTLLADDTNDGLTFFKRMVAQWQKKRWCVPSLVDLATTGNGLISNPIGAGRFWNYPRPDKIAGGYIIQTNTGGNSVSLPLYQIFSYEDYIKITVKNLSSLPEFLFYDGAYPVGNVFIWPIPSSIYDVHLLIKAQLGFSTTIKSGVISAAGQGYNTPGVYDAVALSPAVPGDSSKQFQSYGTGATAKITVAGGVVTTVVLENGGEDFKVNDLLTTSNTLLGGSGTGFTYTVTDTTYSLDSDFNFPPEYEEAVHYNLARRLMSAYQQELTAVKMDEVRKMAANSLRTLQNANAQIPRMDSNIMLRKGKAFNIFNADGY
jgi:hypothetical protein